MKSLKTINENNLIFIDIETASCVRKLKKNTQLYDAWLYKCRYNNELNKKTGKEYTPEEYFYEKAPLYAPFGRAVTIVVGRIKENKILLKSYYAKDEKELLENFNNDLTKVYEANPTTMFCSFSGIGYDIPFIEKRMIVNGIEPCNLLDEGETPPWKATHIDLKNKWKANGFYPDSLIAVATCLGLPSPKDALDGSQVSNYFYAGKIAEIVQYCCKDVETTARIFRKLAFKEDLQEGYELIEEVKVKPLPLLEKILTTKKVDIEGLKKVVKILTTKEEKNKALELVKAVYGDNKNNVLGKEVIEIFS